MSLLEVVCSSNERGTVLQLARNSQQWCVGKKLNHWVLKENAHLHYGDVDGWLWVSETGDPQARQRITPWPRTPILGHNNQVSHGGIGHRKTYQPQYIITVT